MTNDPRGVLRTQSPCRHTPGKSSKYAVRSREPSGSFQNDTGIEGIGFVSTSSPTSSTTSAPRASYAATEAPSAAHDNSPSQTGTVGADSRNAVHGSVPPDIEQICTCRPTASAIQRKPSTDSGAPVEPKARTADMSSSSAGRSPAFRQAWMYGAETPK